MRFEILVTETRDITLSRQRTTKALIRLRGCAGWSAPLLFAYDIRHFFSWPELILGFSMSRLMTKPTKWHVRTAKTQISLGIRPVWSESSLSAWRNSGFSATLLSALRMTLIRQGGCPGISESSLGVQQIILLVLSCGGSYIQFVSRVISFPYEPRHEKTCFSHKRTTKVQISMCIRAV